MSSKSKLTQSRNNWKYKAIEYANEARYLRRENKRLKTRLKEIKKELGAKINTCNQIRKKCKEVEKQADKNVVPINNKEKLVYVALQLFLIANIGFRAVGSRSSCDW